MLLVATCLLVGVFSGCVEEEEETPTNNAPVASFTIEVNETAMTITITDESTDADEDTLTYTWDFGDGETSNSTGPVIEHTYAENGSYTVTLTVYDGTDTDTATETEVNINYVAPVMPEASFTYDPMVNITNTTEVTFTSTSTLGDATNLTYSWDFGDGGTSTEAIAAYTFVAAGTYNVTLTVTDETDTTLTDISDATQIEVTEAT